MTLIDHINTEHGGNKSAFARSVGTTKQQVARWVEYGCLWVDGQVWKQQSNFDSAVVTKDIK